MSDTISHHRASRPSSEPAFLSGPSEEGPAAAPARTARPIARGWLFVAGCVLWFGSLAACGDRRIVFCESGFDDAAGRCMVAAGAGGGGGAGGSAGTMAGASGMAGTAALGGTGGGGAGGTGGSAGGPVDASTAPDAGDAGDPLDAATAP